MAPEEAIDKAYNWLLMVGCIQRFVVRNRMWLLMLAMANMAKMAKSKSYHN